MQINRDQFLEDGYLVLRQVIPPDQLDDLRVSYEHLVKQQKAIWATERSLNAPSGGVWETVRPNPDYSCNAALWQL